MTLIPPRAHAHRALHRALHGATERDALSKLVRDVVGDELRIQLRTLDLFDVDADFLARQPAQLVTQLVDFGSLLSDDDARTTGVDRHHDLARLALDRDVGDRGVTETCVQILAEECVLLEHRGHVTIRVVTRPPVLRDTKAKADWMCLLSHYCSPSVFLAVFFAAVFAVVFFAAVFLAAAFFATGFGFAARSETMMSTWLVRFLIGVARPCAAGMNRLIGRTFVDHGVRHHQQVKIDRFVRLARLVLGVRNG